MHQERKRILEHSQILQIIKRMAYEIYEQNHKTEELFFAGIDTNGVIISELLKKEIEKISDIRIQLIRVDIDKSATSQPQVSFSAQPEVSDFTLIVIDDVLNSGGTMIYALDPFLKMNVSKIQTAVLVNRSHKRFPIAVDYKGFELGTTIQEHIDVKLDDEYSAFLY
ncbi:hypothetical protein BFP97_11935 [Roseivirga sp. 4D4]|uniref:phosphoribosyltransferase family protein n=1 Tax=Roseivirga sp. 4D4 TaxID=1889784 RepID=UPI0008537D1A|nr:phosphoribosyltransferase family protein [Roseivirga sp. 4D4]OEK02187.1 hypothetical protein BFP97_11935 [Roseivirga sp. 4D4]